MCKTGAHHGTRIRQRKKRVLDEEPDLGVFFPRRGGARRCPNPTPQHARVRSGDILVSFVRLQKALAAVRPRTRQRRVTIAGLL